MVIFSWGQEKTSVDLTLVLQNCHRPVNGRFFACSNTIANAIHHYTSHTDGILLELGCLASAFQRVHLERAFERTGLRRVGEL